jgi:hypothetical protein
MHQLNFQQHNKLVDTLVLEFNTNYNETVPGAVLIICNSKIFIIQLNCIQSKNNFGAFEITLQATENK